MTTYQKAIDGARTVLGDPNKVRYPDALCLDPFAIDAIRVIAVARPDLFAIVGDVNCTPGTVRQSLSAVNGLHLIDVHAIKGGAAITMGDLADVRQYRPSWMTDDSGPAQNWFPLSSDIARQPLRDFYIYPKAPNGQVLTAHYVPDPLKGATPTLNDQMPIPDQLTPAVEWYVVFRAESGDEEHVNSQRAMLAEQMFSNIVGVDSKEWRGR